MHTNAGDKHGTAAHITVCANVTFPVLSLTSRWVNLSFFSLGPEEDGAGGDLFILYTRRQTHIKSRLTRTVNTGAAENDTCKHIVM